MSDIRAEWIAMMRMYRLSPDKPDNEQFWCTKLDTAPQEELRGIQCEKLRVAVRYAYECIPFYRRKFDSIGLGPGDIRSVDDLSLIPVTTKQEMAEDLAEHGPWGTYTALDDDLWTQRGWQIFASSGTTAQPRAFRYSQFDREMWMWTNARAMWAMGFRPGRDSALIAFGYGPHVWLWGVAQRLMRFAHVAGRENVIAGTDCGFGTFVGASAVPSSIAWAKLQSLIEGARLASQELW